jgi:hypothetical protein
LKILKYKKIYTIFTVLTVFLLFFFTNLKSNILCSKYGDLIFDKLLGHNTDCYERKLKGVIYPSIKFDGPRFNLVNNKKKLDCPRNSPIVIISGQSNAANFLISKNKFNNKHFNYFNGDCYELNSPALGAEGEMSSVAPAIAQKIKTNKKLIFITSGRGGIPIENASIPNKDFIKYNTNAINFLKKNNNYLKYFIWIHGEANNLNTLNYFENFISIFETIVNNTDNNTVNLIITETSLCRNNPDPKLNQIQRKISHKYNKFEEVIKTDDLQEKYRYDNCHFNERGVEEISKRISKLINKIENE